MSGTPVAGASAPGARSAGTRVTDARAAGAQVPAQGDGRSGEARRARQDSPAQPAVMAARPRLDVILSGTFWGPVRQPAPVPPAPTPPAGPPAVPEPAVPDSAAAAGATTGPGAASGRAAGSAVDPTWAPAERLRGLGVAVTLAADGPPVRFVRTDGSRVTAADAPAIFAAATLLRQWLAGGDRGVPAGGVLPAGVRPDGQHDGGRRLGAIGRFGGVIGLGGFAAARAPGRRGLAARRDWFGRGRRRRLREFDRHAFGTELRALLDTLPDAQQQAREHIVAIAAGFIAATGRPGRVRRAGRGGHEDCAACAGRTVSFLSRHRAGIPRQARRVLRRLPAIIRLKWQLAHRGRADELVKVVRFERGKTTPEIVKRAGRRYLRYPYFAHRRLGIPRHVYKAGQELDLRSRINAVSWHAGRLHVCGEAYVHSFTHRSRWLSVTAFALRSGGARGRRLVLVRGRTRRRPDGCAGDPYRWAGFSFVLDPRRLRRRGQWVDGTWSVGAGVLRPRIFRHAPLRTGASGTAASPPYAYVADDVRVIPVTSGGRLRVRVETVRARADAFGWEGADLVIRGRLRGSAGTGSLRLTPRGKGSPVVIPLRLGGDAAYGIDAGSGTAGGIGGDAADTVVPANIWRATNGWDITDADTAGGAGSGDGPVIADTAFAVRVPLEALGERPADRAAAGGELGDPGPGRYASGAAAHRGEPERDHHGAGGNGADRAAAAKVESWRLEAVVDGRAWPLVLAEPAPDLLTAAVRTPGAGGDVATVAHRTPDGYLTITRGPVRPQLTSCELRADGTLSIIGLRPRTVPDGPAGPTAGTPGGTTGGTTAGALAGTAATGANAGTPAEPAGTEATPGPAEIVLRSRGVRGRRREHVFPVVTVDNEFRAELPLAAVTSIAGRLPLRAGRWDVLYRPYERPPRPVRLGPRGDETGLPVRVLAGGRPYRVDRDAADGLVIEVGSDVTAAEAYRRAALWRRAKRRARRRGLRDAVLYISYSGKQYADSPRAIHEELVRRGDHREQLWEVSDGQVAVPPTVTPVRRRGAEWYDALASCRYIVTNVRLPEFFERRRDQVVVQTWHGTPLKKVGRDIKEVHFAYAPGMDSVGRRQRREKPPEWSYLISPNRFSTEILGSAFGSSYDEILEVGYPRNDMLYSPDAARVAEVLRERLGIPPGKKVVLYAPTWRDDQYYGRGRYKLDLRLDLRYARAALGRDHVLLIRPHSNVVDTVPGVDGDFVLDVSAHPDIAELYLLSDMLVTDYSSVMFDYANTGKPMLFFTYDLEHYRDVLRGFYIDFAEDAPGPLLKSSVEVVHAIRNIDEVRGAYQAAYDRFVERYCDLDDGKAAGRAVDRIFKP